MKKIITFAGIAILFVLLSAPSFVKAAVVGSGIFELDGVTFQGELYCDTTRAFTYPTYTYINGDYWINSNDQTACYFYDSSNNVVIATVKKCRYLYIPTLSSNTSYSWQGYTTYFYNNEDDYLENIPDEFKPSLAKQRWDAFYELFKSVYGYYPLPGSFIDWLRGLALGDVETEDIIFPTNTPTPTPTPTPTSIPVQTIFVPSGNGDYTIIYQYPQPDGTITQSPFNPNIDVNVDVDCDCDGGGQNYNPQDPMYYPFDGLTWASIDGEFTDSPAMTAGNSLDMIKAEAETYDEPIKVVSNSFNVLPVKWLGLVGLLGACLIVAGLIRTFLGG